LAPVSGGLAGKSGAGTVFGAETGSETDPETGAGIAVHADTISAAAPHKSLTKTMRALKLAETQSWRGNPAI
jgi:hypothetical protein